MREYKLGDIAFERKETVKGDKDAYPIVGLEHLISEQVILTEWDQATENTFTKLFREGDVLFGRRRAYLKKAAVAPFDGICSGDITVITAKEDVLSPRLLPFIIQNDMLFDYAVKMSAGGLSPRVKWQNLKDFVVILPDIDKQEELAEILWNIEYTKRAYSKMILKTDELVKSQFIELTTQQEYSKYTVKDILCNSFWLMPATPKYQDAGVIYITSKNLRNREISFEDVKYISQEDYEKIAKNRPIMVGDVLVGMIGTIGQIGVVQDGYPLFYGQNIYLLRLDEQKVNKRYFCEFMRADSTQNILMGTKNGSTQAYLKANHIEGLEIVLPEIQLQNQFEELCIQSDKSKFELQKALDELTAMQKKIMLNTFSEQ